MDLVGNSDDNAVVVELPNLATSASTEDKQSRDGAVARMDVYVEWLLTPSNEREPRTKKALAAELNITTGTLRRYDQDPWMRREFLRRSRAAFTTSRAAEVIDTLYQRATDPYDTQGVSAAKALLHYAMAQDEREPEKGVDLSQFSADQLGDLVEQVKQASG